MIILHENDMFWMHTKHGDNGHVWMHTTHVAAVGAEGGIIIDHYNDYVTIDHYNDYVISYHKDNVQVGSGRFR